MINEDMIRSRIREIDYRVAKLEKTHDNFIATHGEQSEGIMKLINDLMDERDKLSSKLYICSK